MELSPGIAAVPASRIGRPVLLQLDRPVEPQAEPDSPPPPTWEEARR